MKNSILLIALTFLLTACTNNSNAEFEKNTAIAKAFFELHENEDFDQMLTYLHEDMTWHLPGYGMGMGGIEEVKAAILGYHAAFDNMKFEADYWLPGVNTETGLPDGSTRVYGTWISTHKASGKEARLTSYHAFEFKDGKIINGGDWFDLGGMMNALQVEMAEENEEITEN